MSLSQLSHNQLKYHAIWLIVTGIFCLTCLFFSAITPKTGFEVGVQNNGAVSGIVIKRVSPNTEELQSGDMIEAVNGKPVHTRAAFYQQLLRDHDDHAELTIRRTGSRYQRPISSQELAHGAIPFGLTPNDKPIYIETDNGNYAPLENVEFADLKTLIDDRGGSASVIFKRQQDELITTAVPLSRAFTRTVAASLILILIALMGMVVWRNRWKRQNGLPVWANLTLGLASISVLTLGLWSVVTMMPILFLIGMTALSLFKATDLDYHLVYFRLPQKTDIWVRIAIYIGPIVTLLIPIWLCLSEMPVLWGADVSAEVELRLESFIFLPMLWCAIYTIIDGCIILVRRRQNNPLHIHPYEIAVIFSCILAFFILVLLPRKDMMGIQWFLTAAIIAQAFGNIIPAFWTQHNDTSVLRLDSPTFSASPIREALNHASEILGPSWLTQVVIDRPSPKHTVGLMKSTNPDILNGIELNVLSTAWRDFLDVFRTKGGSINGDSQALDPRNPVHGIAEKLGIVIALPIADNVAGTLTSLTLLVSMLKQPDEQSKTPSLVLSSKQREALQSVIEDLTATAPAMVYLSAEMSLDVVGENLDSFVKVEHETAAFALSLRNPTLPLAATEIPHGLLDEEEDPEAASHEKPSTDTNEETSSTSDSFDTKVYDEEVSFLKSQMQALYSQQLREFALADIEFTEAQKLVFEDLESLDPPMLFVGEQNTGKKLLALAAHQDRCEGPFLSIDAATSPESIFALDLFGDGDTPGMIQNAAGGSLFIENIDRLSQDLIKDIIDAVDRQPVKERVSLYLAMNIQQSDIPVSKYRMDPSSLPRRIANIASLCDAEIVLLDPLRDQQDLENIAEFYLQKESTYANKAIESFTPEALLALKSYAWPGNFSELHAIIERAVMKCEGTRMTVSDLGKDFEDLTDASTKNIAMHGTDVYREQVERMQVLNESLQNQINC